ncbi:MAG: hypothetical protein PWP23_436 [Candidatus Sumerlaeota bacterium]|nr:hypothetical protein [Candidatus Sumerlaeota bacterium]
MPRLVAFSLLLGIAISTVQSVTLTAIMMGSPYEGFTWGVGPGVAIGVCLSPLVHCFVRESRFQRMLVVLLLGCSAGSAAWIYHAMPSNPSDSSLLLVWALPMAVILPCMLFDEVKRHGRRTHENGIV